MPREVAPVRAVFFDLGGTLLDFRDPALWAHLAEEVGVTVDADHLLHAVSEVDQATDRGPRLPVSEFWRSVLLRASAAPVSAEMAQGFVDRWLASDRVGSLFSDVGRCLAELAGDGRRLGVISNSRSADHVRRYLTAAGIQTYFAVVVSSGSEGVEKPDREIFDRAARRIGVANREAFHVGDLPETDARGAARAGFRSVWLHREGTGFGDDPPEITSLSELPGYLREIEAAPLK